MIRVAGFHPVREALRSRPEAIRRVWVARSRTGDRRGEIEALCRGHGILLEEVSEDALDALGIEVHNGFAAEMDPGSLGAEIGPDPGLVVLLEDVQDPRNLGAILRVCEGAGVGRVLIRDRGSAPLSEVVARVAAGATEWISVERITNSARTIRELKDRGFWIYGAALEEAPPWEIDLTGNVAFCLGGEEKGLRRRTRELCDGLVSLPMRGRIESLNVASATAALLYEAVRQRTSGGSRAVP